MKAPRVVRFSATGTDGQPVDLTVSTDIIDHIESSRAFGREDLEDAQKHGRFQRRLIAIPDRKSGVVTPMVLTIGNQNGFFLVRKDKASDGGWKLIDLGSAFANLVGSAPQVRASGAAWTDDDRIAVAVAVDDGGAQSASRVFVAYDLSSRDTDWENISWIDCGSRQNVRVEAIRVLDEGSKNWTVVLSGDQGPNDMLYLLRSGATQSFDRALVFNPAVTMQEIFDFEAGLHPTFGGGIHLLGTSGGESVLSFRPFPEYDGAGNPQTIPPVVVLPYPPGANVLEAGRTQPDGSDLYLGGQGVQLISAAELDNAAEARIIQVADGGVTSDVQDLVVGDSSNGDAVVWTLLKNGDLNVVKRTGATGWGNTLRLRSGVQEIAPVEGDGHMTTSLLVVYTDYRASFVWQDAGSGVWQEAPILVASPDQVTSITCYGTSLRVLDEVGAPRMGVKVSVSASVLSSVHLNGNAVFIGPAISFDARSDSNGSISLFDRVRSLTPAIYRFSVEGIEGHLDINPAAGVHERFKSIKADELRQATVATPSGDEPLLPEKFRTGADSPKVDVVSGALNQIAALASSADGQVAGVRQVATNAAFSSALRPEVVAHDFRWGIQADADGVRAASEEVINNLFNAGSSADFFEALGESIADIFEGLGKDLKKEFTFVLRKAEQGFEVVCALGDKVKHFVLDELEKMGPALSWLWDQIGTALERLWDFLKFLLEWEDILLVRRTMVEATDEALKSIKDSVGTLKDNVATGFDHAIERVRQWRQEVGAPPAALPQPRASESFFDQVSKVKAPIQDTVDLVTGNSVVAWVVNKLEGGISELIEFDGPNPLTEAADAAGQFIEGMFTDEVSNLLDCWAQVEADVVRLFDGKMPGLKDLSFETVKGLFVAVGAHALEGLLKGMRDLVLRSLDLVQDMIGVMHDLLFCKVRFPFIEKLIKLVGGKVDTSLTLIDGLMMLCAIPATVGYKIIFGNSPLKKGEMIPLTFGSITVQNSAEAVRLYSYIAGLIAAFGRIADVGPKLWKIGTGEESPPPNPVLEAVLAGFEAISLSAQYTGRHTGKGSDVASIEWTMTSVLTVSTITSMAGAIARLNPKPGFDPQTVQKIEEGINIAGYAVHYVLKVAALSLIIDADRKSDKEEDKAEVTGESLAFVETTLDHAGSILFSSANLVEDKKIKGALLGFGLAVKALTFVLDGVRVIVSGKKENVMVY